MAESARRRLASLLKERAVLQGPVQLSSGGESSFYVDGKQVTLSSEGASLVGALLWEAIRDERVDAIGGPEMGAIPMAVAAVVHAQAEGRPLEGFSVRKKPKEHGTQRLIEGRLEPGSRVVVVDDVITTGTSVLKAIHEVRAAGAEIVKVMSIVDRQAGAAEAFAAEGLRYEPIFTRDELQLD
jgi:orotate phosphoribosyltransferase